MVLTARLAVFTRDSRIAY